MSTGETAPDGSGAALSAQELLAQGDAEIAQARGDTLRKHADRIQARAIRRCGELLKQIQPSKGGQPTHDGGGTSRSKAAADAGLSERQKVTALRVASVPVDDFERQVESDSPPTITALADHAGSAALEGIM